MVVVRRTPIQPRNADVYARLKRSPRSACRRRALEDGTAMRPFGRDGLPPCSAAWAAFLVVSATLVPRSTTARVVPPAERAEVLERRRAAA